MDPVNGTDNPNSVEGGNSVTKDERSAWDTAQWDRHVQSETDRRVKDAQKKWREDLAAQLTAKDKDAETKITGVLEQAKQAEARAAFAELAHKEGIADIRAAWAVVKEYGLMSDKGGVDFNKLKDAHPALFAAAKNTVVRHVDDTKGANGKTDMTALIRHAAQRNVISAG
jgi:hypothetical protein